MFRVTNIRKISRMSEIRTHHTPETSPTLREDSVVEMRKIIFQTQLLITCFSYSRKVPRIKADLLNYRWKLNTVRSENEKIEHRTREMLNTRLFFVPTAWR